MPRTKTDRQASMLDGAMAAAVKASFRELFKPQYLRRLVVLVIGYSLLIFALSGILSWIPTVLVDRGMPLQTALNISSITTLGSLAGAPIIFAFTDKLERKTLMLIEAGVGGVATLIFGFSGVSVPVIIVTGFIAITSLAATSASFNTYIPEVFPTEVRGIGGGTVSGIARLAGIAAGVVVAGWLTSLSDWTVYLILGVDLALVGVVVFAFGPRSTRRSLEVISPE